MDASMTRAWRPRRRDVGTPRRTVCGGGQTVTLQVLRFEQHRRMPWRNGGGVTYEVASSPAGSDLAGFDWRISIAEVQDGGPFSTFPGVDRTIVLVDGEWMALTVDGRRHRFGRREPFSFAGDSDTTCEVAGPSRDLNVMTRRGRAGASVVIREAGAPRPVPAGAGALVLVGLSGEVAIAQADGTEVQVSALDAVVSTGLAPLTLGGDGAVAVIEVALVHRRRDSASGR